MEEIEVLEKIKNLLISIDSRLNTIESILSESRGKANERKGYQKENTWKNEPATEKQVFLLVKKGLPKEIVEKMTKDQASKLIDKLLNK